jgi:hypothetical protein
MALRLPWQWNLAEAGTSKIRAPETQNVNWWRRIVTQAYAFSNPSRKGQALLTRLDKLLRFESTIEERFLRVLDFAADVRSVERAETHTIYAPDGTSHTYTSDFLVTLEDQRVLCVECKPAGLLKSLLRDDQHNWEARAIRLEQLGQKLYVVTEKDLVDVLVQQAISFGAFYSVPADPKISGAALAFLKERRALPLSVLRTHVQVMTGCSSAALDGTLFGMVARHELVTDLTSPVPFHFQ